MDEWLKQRKREHFFGLAKEDNKYRARSAFKLLQIHNTFNILKQGQTILDIGSAPGSWSQVALEKSGNTGKIVAVDILPMAPLEGVEIVTGDIMKESTQEEIAEHCKKFDVILSDASPEFSGVREIDMGKAVAINEMVIELSGKFLKKGGSMVIKAFHNNQLNQMVMDLKKKFRLVKLYKPKASIKNSSEIYIVCIRAK